MRVCCGKISSIVQTDVALEQLADCAGEVQSSGSTADRDGVEPIDLVVEAEAAIKDVMEQIRIRSNDNKKCGG